LHEMGIAMNVYDSSRREMEKHAPGGRLYRVRVAVGELSAIEPELLRFAWQAVVEDRDAGCELDIEWRPARQYCPQCDQMKSRPEGGWLILCPDCEHALRVEGGYELDLLQVTFEADESSGGPSL
jgi:hydrogenase nickel incorporation protein HypA/HybF